jgi:hypothetical protein
MSRVMRRFISMLAMSTIAAPMGGCSENHGTQERAAVQALGILRQAEEEFQSKDIDKNGVRDYWTGDVVGLYRYGLIPRELAEADAAPLQKLADHPRPYHGYLFLALDSDDMDEPSAAGKVHNRETYWYCAFPKAYPETGQNTYLTGMPSGAVLDRSTNQGRVVLRWPNAEDRKENWWIVD